MPIVVNDYTWRETENTVTVRVPLHMVPQNRVDLILTSQYLKASFEYFIFECFPCFPIAPDESQCTTQEDFLLFELKKTKPEMWHKLEQGELTKNEKRDIRNAALEEMQNREETSSEKKRKMKSDLKREAIELSIELNAKERSKITEIKEQEKIKALGDVHEWCNPKNMTENIENKIKTKENKKKNKKSSKTQTFSMVKEENEEKDKVIPLPRTKCTVEVEFTPRVFPTPCRESKEAEENEWLAKQAAARRSAGFVSEDLRAEERNPHYILAKGNDFLKVGNFLGAISAYSYGLEISPKMVDFYVKRSEAQFALGNYQRTTTDCSAALDLMKPEVSANLEDRVTCIGRRGLALGRLGMRKQAMDELRAALRLKPGCEELRKMFEEVRNLDETNSVDGV